MSPLRLEQWWWRRRRLRPRLRCHRRNHSYHKRRCGTVKQVVPHFATCVCGQNKNLNTICQEHTNTVVILMYYRWKVSGWRQKKKQKSERVFLFGTKDVPLAKSWILQPGFGEVVFFSFTVLSVKFCLVFPPRKINDFQRYRILVDVPVQ